MKRVSIPPALVVGLAVPIAWAIVRTIWLASYGGGRVFAPRLMMTGEGIAFSTLFLAIAGSLELRQRFTGTARMAITLAFAGLAIALASDVIAQIAQFSDSWWARGRVWLFHDAGSVGRLAFALGLTIALPATRRIAGAAGLVIAFVTWPPHGLREPLFGWLHLNRESEIYFYGGILVGHHASVLALAVAASSGTTTADGAAAAWGLRLAAKGLWLRIIAAVSLALVTLLVVASRDGGGIEIVRFATIAQGFVAVLSLVVVATGVLHAAGAAVTGLSASTLVAVGGASLWGAGVTLAELPYLYHVLYRSEGEMLGGKQMMQALSTAMPIVVSLGTALLATALSGFAARRGNESLRADAQACGIAFLVLMLGAIGLQSWLLPKAESIDREAMIMLGAAAAGLWATAFLAKLVRRGADAIDAEPSLPPANLVSG